jgi:hypothetical protein
MRLSCKYNYVIQESFVKGFYVPNRLSSLNILCNLRLRRVSIALRHSQVEFTEFCSLGVC